jgi:hypothetical protein
MAYDLSAISTEAVVRPPRIVLLGEEKIGKSEFAAASDRAVILPIKREEGIDELKCSKLPVSNTFDDVIGWLGSLLHGEHGNNTVVIDSSSTLEKLIWERVCARHNANGIETVLGGFAKGYTEALTEWQSLMDYLDALRNHRNMTTIVVGHVHVKMVNDPTTDAYDQVQWDIHKSASSALRRWADVTLFMGRKVAAKKEDQGFGKTKSRGIDVGGDARFLFTKGTPSHQGGGRGVWGRLPDEINMGKSGAEGWAAFTNAVAAAMAQ